MVQPVRRQAAVGRLNCAPQVMILVEDQRDENH